jgi:uncharacterized protein YoxC
MDFVKGALLVVAVAILVLAGALCVVMRRVERYQRGDE